MINLLAIIFAAELVIMSLLSVLPPLATHVQAVFDAVVLSFAIFPALYFLVLRPMQAYIAKRDQAEDALLAARAELEQRVRDRTEALEQANTALRADMAEREQTETRLREAEMRYRTLFEQSPDGILLVDPQTMRPVEFNDVAHQQLGYTREEFVRLTVRDYEALLTPEETAARVEQVMRAGRASFETRHTTKTGERRHVHVIAQTIESSGRRLFYCIYRDITERAQALAEVRQWAQVLEARNREMAVLTELGDMLQACAKAEEAYRAIAQAAGQLFPEAAGALFTYSPSRNELEAVAVWGDFSAMTAARLFVPEMCWALRRGRVHRLDDTRYGVPCRHLPEPLPARYLCVPMMAHGETLGVLHVQANRTNEAALETSTQPEWSAQEWLAVTLAERIGLALSNLALRDRLRSQSIRDPLTGLFNRRYLEEALEREIRRAERNGSPVGIAMLDLDHFKPFNDTHGHDAGDVLLREVGALLMSSTRGGDMACRYGGEEFVLILPEATLDETRQRTEQILNRIRRLQVRHRGLSLGGITASGGVASYPEYGAVGAGLLKAADMALYQAKAQGRNRVVVAESGGREEANHSG